MKNHRNIPEEAFNLTDAIILYKTFLTMGCSPHRLGADQSGFMIEIEKRGRAARAPLPLGTDQSGSEIAGLP